jgi:threonine/homoserine/homoserine lactone efflux protein
MPLFDPTLLAAYSLAALALALTPGPDMLYCLTAGVAGGPRAGLVAGAGITAALLLHVAAATFGLAGLVATSPLAFEALRWLGAGYLLWLAWQSLRAGPLQPGQGVESEVQPLSLIFRRAMLTCLLNPKLLLFLFAFLPQFVRPEAGSVPLQTLILGLILVVPGLLINTAVGLGGGRLGQWLLRNPAWSRWQNRIVAAVMLGLALRLVLGTRS